MESLAGRGTRQLLIWFFESTDLHLSPYSSRSPLSILSSICTFSMSAAATRRPSEHFSLRSYLESRKLSKLVLAPKDFGVLSSSLNSEKQLSLKFE